MNSFNTHRNIKPKVGLAFSGASSRSIFYIGFLEVLKENDFPIDYIAAMSGAAIVAASFASNTLPELKKLALNMDKEVLFSFIERSKNRGGLYSLSKVESYMRVYTKNLKFEEVKPRLGFVATDIAAGEEVVLQVGDIARAVCASCTLPGVFEPVEWGHKQLVDGGIINVIPGNVARASGVDIVIGIDMRNTRHVFSSWQINLRKISNFVKSILWPSQLDQLWHNLITTINYSGQIDSYSISQTLQDKYSYPGIFSVLGRSLDLAIQAQKEQEGVTNYDCNLIIVPEITSMSFWKRYSFMHFTDFSHTKDYYFAGRQTAQKHLPQLWELLAKKEEEMANNDQKVKSLLNNQTND